MRKLILLYFAWVLFFVIGTLIFLLWHYDIFGLYSVSDWLQVLLHSLPHDLTVAGYVMVLPVVVKLVHYWVAGDWFRRFLSAYLATMGALVLLLVIVDLVLFGYWGFRLDATPLIYLTDSPAETLKQAYWWQYLLLAVTIVAMVSALVYGINMWLREPKRKPRKENDIKLRAGKTLLGLLVGALMFLAIRGGVSESTMNVGRAYFSTEQMLNQAAVNPVFSFLYAVGKRKDYGQMYRFMTDDECHQAWAELNTKTGAADPCKADSVCSQRVQYLKTPRPNIVLIILEGMSGGALSTLYPETADPRVMPCLARLYDEGLGFTRFYANSWRTDRGVASILAAYPAQPTTTVMKDQSKCNHLQFLPKRLHEAGYDLDFTYGGDINFTNMQGFLRAGGYGKIRSADDFPRSEHQQEWGVPDHIMYAHLYDEILAAGSERPWMKTLLTLSSHEPFDVPDFHRLEHPFANSLAYADSCLGQFICQLKAQPEVWENLLVIALPDHCSAYPEYEMPDPDRYHIPMIWTGGAVSAPCRIDALGQQTDLAATLLGQMGLPHDDFMFSKDLFDPHSPRYAFYTYPDGLGLLAQPDDSTMLCYVQDNQQDRMPLKWTSDKEHKAQTWGRAALQTLMDDLAQR